MLQWKEGFSGGGRDVREENKNLGRSLLLYNASKLIN